MGTGYCGAVANHGREPLDSVAREAAAIQAAVEKEQVARAARDKAIGNAYAAGASREAIAEAAGLTTRQVHRIVVGK